MARRVIWSEAAKLDLGNAASYIRRDSKRYAAALVRQARDMARTLASWPERGPMVEDLEDPGLREVVVGQYRMIYYVARTRIQILGFIHGARDLSALWHREKRTPPEQ